eukprot:365474-Chlamydomonas_euryale.AAC.6
MLTVYISTWVYRKRRACFTHTVTVQPKNVHVIIHNTISTFICCSSPAAGVLVGMARIGPEWVRALWSSDVGVIGATGRPTRDTSGIRQQRCPTIHA